MKKRILAVLLCTPFLNLSVYAQTDYQTDSVFISKIFNAALGDGKCYEVLRHLTMDVGSRLSGSSGAAKAVEYTRDVMKEQQFDNVFLQNVMVPHWVRGAKEEGYILNGKQKTNVPIAALGG